MLKRIAPFLLLCLILVPTSLSSKVDDGISKADRLAEEKKYDEAIKAYEEVLIAQPKNIVAHTTLGLIYANAGNMEKAIQYTKKASEIDPSSSTPLYNLGLMYATNEEPEKAIEAFDKALAINPESFMAEYQKGLVYTSQESYSEAARSYERTLKLNPQFDDARLALAAVLHKEGDRPAALVQVEEFQKLHKDTLAKALAEWIEEKKF